MSLYSAKFFDVEAKFTLVKLGRTRQSSGKDLDFYMRRFYEKALDCSPMEEKVLVNFCLHGMLEEYTILLENLSFSKLMKAAGYTKESMHRTLRSSTGVRLSQTPATLNNEGKANNRDPK